MVGSSLRVRISQERVARQFAAKMYRECPMHAAMNFLHQLV